MDCRTDTNSSYAEFSQLFDTESAGRIPSDVESATKLFDHLQNVVPGYLALWTGKSEHGSSSRREICFSAS
jgi:hypothetical protein